jgi:hypothetical protein
MGLLVHLTVLGTYAAPLVRASTIIERRRRDCFAFHSIYLCVAGYLDLRLRHEEAGFGAGGPGDGAKEHLGRLRIRTHYRDTGEKG